MAGKRDDIVNKPDPFRVFFERVIRYFTVNIMQAYALLGVIALLFVGSAGWYLYSANYENSARILYDKALTASITGTMDRKAILKVYQDVVGEYPRSKAAVIASYLIGNLYYNLNDIDAAIKSYKEFLKRAPSDNTLTAFVYSGLGYCYEAKKDYKNALSAYEDALKNTGSSQFAVMNYRNAARICESLNNPAKALEYYKKALMNNTDPALDILIKKKMSTLG
ncbi:MAG: tetratricopeptide repeat protein [Deltaproteobacteria bacterium]|nr:tetratricopeptide repeat protein [Deltaproteobacteria bacterium]